VSVAASLTVAKILEKVVLGSTVRDAMDWAETEGEILVLDVPEGGCSARTVLTT
jgi:hypothetical protein